MQGNTDRVKREGAMSTSAAAEPSNSTKGILGKIEEIGNKVPHPALIFVYLIVFVILLSTVLGIL
jgi:aminobenzoyl-glutamate transport protein